MCEKSEKYLAKTQNNYSYKRKQLKASSHLPLNNLSTELY